MSCHGVSSSTDDTSIYELCAQVSRITFGLELQMENISRRVKAINAKITNAKEVALEVHAAGRESAREDILSDLSALEYLEGSVQKLSSLSEEVARKFHDILHD